MDLKQACILYFFRGGGGGGDFAVSLTLQAIYDSQEHGGSRETTLFKRAGVWNEKTNSTNVVASIYPCWLRFTYLLVLWAVISLLHLCTH